MSEVKAIPPVPGNSFFILRVTASLTCLYKRGNLALENVVGFLMWNFRSRLAMKFLKACVETRLKGRLAWTRNFVTSRSNFSCAFDLMSNFKYLLNGVSRIDLKLGQGLELLGVTGWAWDDGPAPGWVSICFDFLAGVIPRKKTNIIFGLFRQNLATSNNYSIVDWERCQCRILKWFYLLSE